MSRPYRSPATEAGWMFGDEFPVHRTRGIVGVIVSKSTRDGSGRRRSDGDGGEENRALPLPRAGTTSAAECEVLRDRLFASSLIPVVFQNPVRTKGSKGSIYVVRGFGMHSSFGPSLPHEAIPGEQWHIRTGILRGSKGRGEYEHRRTRPGRAVGTTTPHQGNAPVVNQPPHNRMIWHDTIVAPRTTRPFSQYSARHILSPYILSFQSTSTECLDFGTKTHLSQLPPLRSSHHQDIFPEIGMKTHRDYHPWER